MPAGLAGRISEVGGFTGKQLRRAIRDYARTFHTSVTDLEKKRVTDFLIEYAEAVEALDRAIALGGRETDLLAQKVFALWYRDGRRFTDESNALVAEILAKNPHEVQTRMLLGQDAFLQGRWEAAVKEWRMLLESGVAPEKTRALKNAIAKAEAEMAHQEN